MQWTMDDAPDPGDEHRDRRMRIAVRLVLYPIALGLIALAWQQYHGAPAKGHVYRIVNWSGVTSQGQEVRGRTGDDVLTWFSVHVVERCSDGSAFTAGWRPGQRHFEQRGADLRGHDTGPGTANGGRPARYDDRIWARMGEHPRGTIRSRVSRTTEHGKVIRCESGPVTFALRPSP
jgi:hypothetical protein